MTTHGKTVRIYLADGSPTGIRHAEVVNWTGQAIVCPRGRIGELTKWPEAQRPGLYILIGEDPKQSRPMAYIGEAENVLIRLKNHVAKKDFWDQVVFFTSKDDNLTKVHVKYLESRIVELAHDAQRIHLENSTMPPRPTLPRSDRDSMEEFLDPARILLGALGFPFLEVVRSSKQSQALHGSGGPLAHITLSFEVPKRGVKAEGTATDEGFVVAKGAVGPKAIRKSLATGWGQIRMDLIDEGAIEVKDAQIRFTRDVLFKSPSAAAAIVCGGVWNGRQGWKDPSGASLSDLETTLLESTNDLDEEYK